MSLTVRTQTIKHFELTISSDELREVINNFLVQKFFEEPGAGVALANAGPDFSKKVKVEIEKRAGLLMDEGLTAFETFEDGPAHVLVEGVFVEEPRHNLFSLNFTISE